MDLVGLLLSTNERLNQLALRRRGGGVERRRVSRMASTSLRTARSSAGGSSRTRRGRFKARAAPGRRRARRRRSCGSRCRAHGARRRRAVAANRPADVESPNESLRFARPACRRPDADARRLNRHQRAGGEFSSIARQGRDAHRALFLRPVADKPDDAGVRMATNDHQFAEILVECNQHRSCSGRVSENLGVPGIRGPVRDSTSCPAIVSASRAPPHTQLSRRTFKPRS
jgi:hypothetical protein